MTNGSPPRRFRRLSRSSPRRRKEQIIAFPAIADRVIDSGDVTLEATASSGLAVSYTSATPAVCSVSGETASLLAVGTCTITADQPGDAEWLAATTVSQTFQVLAAPKKEQTIAFPAIADRVIGSGDVTLEATASSGLAVSYTSTTPAVCSVSARPRPCSPSAPAPSRPISPAMPNGSRPLRCPRPSRSSPHRRKSRPSPSRHRRPRDRLRRRDPGGDRQLRPRRQLHVDDPGRVLGVRRDRVPARRRHLHHHGRSARRCRMARRRDGVADLPGPRRAEEGADHRLPGHRRPRDRLRRRAAGRHRHVRPCRQLRLGDPGRVLRVRRDRLAAVGGHLHHHGGSGRRRRMARRHDGVPDLRGPRCAKEGADRCLPCHRRPRDRLGRRPRWTLPPRPASPSATRRRPRPCARCPARPPRCYRWAPAP